MGRRKNNAIEFQEEKRQLKELQKEMEDLKRIRKKHIKRKMDYHSQKKVKNKKKRILGKFVLKNLER